MGGRVTPMGVLSADSATLLCFIAADQVGTDLDGFGCVTGYRYSFCYEDELTRAIVDPAVTRKELASPSSCAARPPNFCFRLAILKTYIKKKNVRWWRAKLALLRPQMK